MFTGKDLIERKSGFLDISPGNKWYILGLSEGKDKPHLEYTILTFSGPETSVLTVPFPCFSCLT